MIPIHSYRGKSVGVFGLGKAGEAAVAALLAGGAEVYAWDDGEASREALAKKYPRAKLATIARWPWDALAFVAVGPGIPYTHPAQHPIVWRAQEAGVEVVGEVELLYRACPEAAYVGITGTNGKSTTTALIAHILKEGGLRVEVGGNLGTPALALEPLGAEGIYVLEMSSYQLDLVRSVRFNVAVLLNLTPDHLDRHGDMEGYLAAKRHIFDRQQLGDTAVVGVDDAWTQGVAGGSWLAARGATVVGVSARDALPQGIYVENGILHDACNQQLTTSNFDLSFDISTIPTLQGRHNWQNAAAAYAAARACGVAPEVIARAMKSFPGLAHRMEQVGEMEGVRFINDSKATNADATANALAAYDTIYWILGGKPKAGGIVSLAEYFPRIAHAFLIGEASTEFARTLEGKVNYTQCGTLDAAVREAAALALREGKKGAVVLLSPACASFDQFKSFEERGDRFRELVATCNLQLEPCNSERHAS